MKDLGHKDQADHLREKAAKKDSFEYSTSSLPSRKEVHGKKKQKIVWKVKYPLLKLLTLFFILLIISTFAIYSYLTRNDETQEVAGEKKNSISETAGENETNEDSVIIDMSEDDDEEVIKEEEEDKNPEQSEQDEKKDEKPSTKPTVPQEKTEPKKPQKEPVKNNTGGSNNNNGSKNEDDYRIIEHVVKPQETMFRISMNYYSSQEGIPLIKEWNDLKGNEIRVGQVLKIPIKK